MGVFCTLGSRRDEDPAQERLIERDLRDMAQVSMLRHAGTGLWWAVKNSVRLRTTVYFASVCTCGMYGCMGVYICAVGAITFACTFYLVLLGRDASVGSRKSPSLLTAISLKSWHLKTPSRHGSFGELAWHVSAAAARHSGHEHSY